MPSSARWLLCIVIVVIANWQLLVAPAAVLSVVPALWWPPEATTAAPLPRHPKTRIETFELGWHAARYDAASCPSEPAASTTCSSILSDAGQVLGGTRITGHQLMTVRNLLQAMDEERSVIDRIMGFFSFVNLVWLVSIIGILATVGPFLAWTFGQLALRIARFLYDHVILPGHRVGVFEVAAYALAFGLIAQASRYPQQQAGAAVFVALTGGLGLAPCWAYSTSLHTTPTPGKEEAFMSLSGGLLALALAPLALIHGSRLLGFATLCCVFVALGFVFGAFFGGFYIGFRNEDSTFRVQRTSAILVVLFSCMRIAGVSPWILQPFASAAMVLGNVLFFLSMLITTSAWCYKGSYRRSYVTANVSMVLCLLVASFVGHVFVLPAASNTASVFFVLYVMEKQLEVDWGPAGIAVLFANFVGAYFLAHHLHTHPEIVHSVFDPEGMYVCSRHDSCTISS